MAAESMVPGQLVQAWTYVKPFFNMVYPNLAESLPSLVVMMISIAIYGVVIYHFYRFVAKRDVFKFQSDKYKTGKTGGAYTIINAIIGTIEYSVLFPVVVFLWFGGFSLMLFLLAKNIEIAQVLLVSVVFVAAIRLTAYYTEELAKDLAKMVPLALLGIAIIEPNFFSLELFFERAGSIAQFLPQIASYFIFIILLEWALRILLFLKHIIFGVKQKAAEG